VAQSLTGWRTGEAAGQALEQVFVIRNEQTGQPAENPVARVLREGTVVGLANHTVLVARDGTTRPIEDSAAPIKDEAGEIRGVVLVFHDVTERREAERRKDQFLAILAHELRNPLAPIRNALQILKHAGANGEVVARVREMAERQVHALTRLVDDLLDVSRIMRGKIELRRERVDLAGVADRAVETARPVLDAEGHELAVALPEEPVWIDVDVVRMAQALANLLNNAAKYTPKGGRVELTAGREGQQAVVRVRDTGLGISPEMLDRIFEMFTQVDAVGSRSQGGLGIGLTVVRSLVEMHGGTVAADSAGLGQGSEFVVRLPLAEPPRGSASRAEEDPAERPSARKILVVDDNRDAADSLVVLLRLAGQEVQVAYDGPSALAQAEADPPAIAFLDLGMPKMDGYELARAFRAQPALQGTLLVAVTGWGQPEDRQRTTAAGFDFHLVKPAEPAVLDRLLTAAALRPSAPP
jgi:PAS domain S-box-containing protein